MTLHFGYLAKATQIIKSYCLIVNTEPTYVDVLIIVKVYNEWKHRRYPLSPVQIQSKYDILEINIHFYEFIKVLTNTKDLFNIL